MTGSRREQKPHGETPGEEGNSELAKCQAWVQQPCTHLTAEKQQCQKKNQLEMGIRVCLPPRFTVTVSRTRGD